MEAEDGCKIKLTFEQFELEDYRCKYDYLTISGTPGPVAEEPKKYCGTSISPSTTFSSIGNTMNVTFVYDYIYSYPGFKATWESILNTNEE